jgi:hypothetical protein
MPLKKRAVDGDDDDEEIVVVGVDEGARKVFPAPPRPQRM